MSPKAETEEEMICLTTYPRLNEWDLGYERIPVAPRYWLFENHSAASEELNRGGKPEAHTLGTLPKYIAL